MTNDLPKDLRIMSLNYSSPMSDLLERAADKIDALTLANERLSKEIELLHVQGEK